MEPKLKQLRHARATVPSAQGPRGGATTTAGGSLGWTHVHLHDVLLRLELLRLINAVDFRTFVVAPGRW